MRQKPELASLVVVMVTTETELDQMAAALEAGANEYVMKPFTRDILVEKLRTGGNSSLSEGHMATLNKRLLQPGERIRVLVVDDSVVIRRLVTHALEAGSCASRWWARRRTALIALQRIPQLNPDVLTLDIEMPEMDGLETLRHIRREYPQLRVIMFSTLTERGAAVTLEALTLGPTTT